MCVNKAKLKAFFFLVGGLEGRKRCACELNVVTHLILSFLEFYSFSIFLTGYLLSKLTHGSDQRPDIVFWLGTDVGPC